MLGHELGPTLFWLGATVIGKYITWSARSLRRLDGSNGVDFFFRKFYMSQSKTFCLRS